MLVVPVQMLVQYILHPDKVVSRFLAPFIIIHPPNRKEYNVQGISLFVKLSEAQPF